MIFSNYSDVAGTENDRGYLIGVTLVSTEKKWLKHEQRWAEALRPYSRIPGIHWTDYMQQVPREPYDSLTDTERDALETKLVNVTKRGVHQVLVTRIQVGDYRAMDAEYRIHEELGSPYNYLAWVTLFKTAGWIDRKHPGARWIHFFERGDTGQGPFRDFIDKKRVAGVFFREKIDVQSGNWLRPFESADMIAWAVRRHSNRKPIPRMLGVKIQKQMNVRSWVFNRDGLSRMCAAHPDYFPRRI